jgi:hypothetical protein
VPFRLPAAATGITVFGDEGAAYEHGVTATRFESGGGGWHFRALPARGRRRMASTAHMARDLAGRGSTDRPRTLLSQVDYGRVGERPAALCVRSHPRAVFAGCRAGNAASGGPGFPTLPGGSSPARNATGRLPRVRRSVPAGQPGRSRRVPAVAPAEDGGDEGGGRRPAAIRAQPRVRAISIAQPATLAEVSDDGLAADRERRALPCWPTGARGHPLSRVTGSGPAIWLVAADSSPTSPHARHAGLPSWNAGSRS